MLLTSSEASLFGCLFLRIFGYLAQASTGKQGVLGPTKIYLAVQPSQSDGGGETTSTNPPPLAPVQQSPLKQQLAAQSPVKHVTLAANTVKSNLVVQVSFFLS